MEKEKLKEFQNEFLSLITKYGLKNVSVPGMAYDNFIGIFALTSTDEDMFDAAMCVGRLWQHTREQVRAVLNSFERESS